MSVSACTHTHHLLPRKERELVLLRRFSFLRDLVVFWCALLGAYGGAGIYRGRRAAPPSASGHTEFRPLQRSTNESPTIFVGQSPDGGSGQRRGVSRPAAGRRRPVAEWPPGAKLCPRPSSEVSATARVASRCSNSLLLRPMHPPIVCQNPAACLVWLTSRRNRPNATGSAGQRSRRRRQNGLTASSPRGCC